MSQPQSSHIFDLSNTLDTAMAAGHSANRRLGLIWPRDPLPKNAIWRRGQRLRDVLTGKGPDIFFGDIDGPTLRPGMARWSRWWDLHGEAGDQDHLTLPPLPWADRGNERYDFMTRKYRIPDASIWSKIEYPGEDDPPGGPLCAFWDINGTRWLYFED